MHVTDIPELLVTDRTAAALGLAVGDTVDVAADAGMATAQHFRISGIYRPKADPFEIGYGRLHLKMHLPDLNRVLHHDDQVDRFVVRLRDPTDRAAATADLNGTLVGLRAYTSEDLAARASSTFVVMSQFHKAIGVVSLLAGLVFLVAIMVLKVEEMRRELAVLRLLGISRRTVVRSVLAIATLVALLGSVVGIGLGVAGARCRQPAGAAPLRHRPRLRARWTPARDRARRRTVDPARDRRPASSSRRAALARHPLRTDRTRA